MSTMEFSDSGVYLHQYGSYGLGESKQYTHTVCIVYDQCIKHDPITSFLSVLKAELGTVTHEGNSVKR